METLPTTIERLIKKKQWSRARAALQEALALDPDDHWLWMHLGLTYYEQKKYEPALKCCEHAIRLAPDCALAKWHFAGALAMTGHERQALEIWSSMLQDDVEEIAFGDHGEGMDWALQLLNDVHFRMGRCWQHLGLDDLARQSFQKYLHNRRHRVKSIYDVNVAERCLREIDRAGLAPRK